MVSAHDPADSRSVSRVVALVALVAVASIAVTGGVAAAAGDAGVAPEAGLAPGVDDGHSPADDDANVTTVVLRLEDPGPTVLDGTNAEDEVSTLQAHAEQTQAPLVDAVESTDGVAVRNTFWITNAVVVAVDRDRVARSDLRALPNVEWVHDNVAFEPASPVVREVSQSAAAAPAGAPVGGTDRHAVSTIGPADLASSGEATYGLEQINAPDVWDAYGTKGEGTTIAVLDSGIDVDHPDLELYTTDPSDPTYPGGWAEFDAEGNEIEDSTPYDVAGHGTHVSGTVAGGAESGEHIGVAPETTLLHGGVLTPEGGTFGAVLAGMEWAVEQDADVVSMSLGTEQDGESTYYEYMIDPVRNTEAAGTMVVSSSGNDGEDVTGSPGNVYDTFSVGASNENEEIWSGSSGEVVDTGSAWSDPPSDWPDEYVVPDVAAPGVWVRSSAAGGGYELRLGTSMAAPHVSGAVALAQSASDEDLGPADFEAALVDTAWKPDGAPSGQDTRYGHGIIDAHATTQALVDDGGSGAPAELIVTNVGTNSPVEEGETLVVDATVENVGDQSGSQSVTLDVDGTQDSTDVTLSGGDSTTVSLEWATETGDAGGYTAVVDTDDDSASTSVTVEEAPEPATFAVSALDPESYTAGHDEVVTVSATVENTGDESGQSDVELQVDGTTEATTSVVLDSGGSTTVEFTFDASEFEGGEYTHAVATPDDQVSGDLTVEADPIDGTRIVQDEAVAPGESTEVELTVSLDEATGVEIVEQFDPAVADAALVDDDDAGFVDATVQEVVAAYDDRSSVTLVYEVTVPDDASAGDSFEISSDVAGGNVDAGTTTIDVVDDDTWWSSYTNDDGVADSAGQVIDAIDDFEATGNPGAGQIVTLIESFETGTPVSELVDDEAAGRRG